MKSASRIFEEYIESVDLTEPKDIKFISTLTGNIEDQKLTAADYWTEQMVQPVQFMRGIKTALELLPAVGEIVELGPGATLIKMAKQIASDTSLKWSISSKAMNSF